MRKYFSLFALLALFSACGGSEDPGKGDPQPQDPMKFKDSHSYAEPEVATVTHLDWKATVDFESHIISAIATLDVDAADDAERLTLDTRGLTIEKVTDESGEALDHEMGKDDPHLGSALMISLKKGGAQKVIVQYQTAPDAQALQWLDPVQTAGKTHPFLFTQSQAILARTWIPIQDGPGIRFTYTAEVTVPKELMAVMSASNPTEKSADGVYRFKMEQPIPGYLMALAVGDLSFAEVGAHTGVYAEPAQLQAAVYEFGEMEDMLTNAEKLYGPYRWERYDLLVLPPSFPFGGMENPRLTFATPTILAGDRSLTALVAHELAHSWSGNLVTNATWDDFWLNEGFTVYFERRIMEALIDSSYADMLTVLGWQDLQETLAELGPDSKDTQLKLALEGRDPDDGMTDIAYEKGYFLLRHLEETVGREKWDAFLRQYFDKHAFTVMTTEAFVEYLNAELLTDEDLKSKAGVEEWIYKSGLPSTATAPLSDRFAAVDERLNEWNGGASATGLNTEGWTTHEHLHFLRGLPESISPERMKDLDVAFGYTASGNSEILAAWFMHAIRNDYEDAFGELEEFLLRVGRRKFLKPLYTALAGNPKSKEWALDVYQRARANYHSVSTGTIDEILGYQP